MVALWQKKYSILARDRESFNGNFQQDKPRMRGMTMSNKRQFPTLGAASFSSTPPHLPLLRH